MFTKPIEMKNQTAKSNSLDEVTEKYIGKRGTPKREAFENELRLDLLTKTNKLKQKR